MEALEALVEELELKEYCLEGEVRTQADKLKIIEGICDSTKMRAAGVCTMWRSCRCFGSASRRPNDVAPGSNSVNLHSKSSVQPIKAKQ